MPNYTEKLNLEKPLREEQYNVAVFNANADKIDTFATNTDINIGNINTSINSINSNITGLQNTVNNKIDLDYSNADYQPVNKLGDTMTGDLNIRKSNSHLYLYNTNLTKGTTPSSNQYSGIEFCDNKTIDASWENKRLGVIEYGLLPSGASRLTISAYKNEAGSDVAASIRVEIDSSGTASCTFPNTISCDGQYVHAYQKLVDNLNLNNSSSSDTGWYSLSSLPNDYYPYLVWLVCNVRTGSTSGNYVYNIIKSDIETTGMTGASARTRTNSAVGNEGTICIPVNGNHRIKVARNSDWTGTGDVTMIGYRRIGQNS